MRGRGFVLVVAAVVVVTAFLAGSRRTTGEPFDPRSSAPDGARALVELVGAFGTMRVQDGVPGPGTDTAILLVDRYDRGAAEELRRWVAAGGTLVVADPASAFTPVVGAAVEGPVDVSCDAPLGAVARLDLGDGRLFDTDGAGCRSEQGAVVQVESVGAGTIVAVGSPWLFTNGALDHADNPVLAVGLLAPTPGTRSAFLAPRPVVGAGEKSLVDLIGTPVRAALAQLVVVFLVVLAWRSRRLGAPVPEPQAVVIESSELAVAVGRLLERNGHPERAAATLRDRARRDLSPLLGLPLDAPAEVVVSTIVARTGLEPTEVRAAVASPVTSDDDLVAVAALLVRIREEITHGRRATQL